MFGVFEGLSQQNILSGYT